MAWYDESIFYHIYPLGLLGAPMENKYDQVTHRLRELKPWVDHIKAIGCNALYIGPLFESVGHGYETTDYRKLDSRLGDNEDLKEFVKQCHDNGIRVILDGVFNHTGRDFFAFKDIKEHRENSRYKDWYCNVNFWGNNEYNDGFSYDNWGGYNLLVKLNQRNPEVKDYICDTIRFWVSEFDIDGLRLDAADVLDFDFMKALRNVANEVKPDFWLMGEVIHGDYTRWVNEGTLHSVTNYVMHKGLYSGHNEHNYFEIAHTQRRLEGMGSSGSGRFKLYNFVDNHDVERIYTKLYNKAHFTPVHVLLYTLPGIPSIYYGSEFAIEGRKERGSDASLRPYLNYEDYKDAINNNPATKLIAALGKIRKENPELSYGDYNELWLRNRQYAFSRNYNGRSIVVTVNNDDCESWMNLPAGNTEEYMGALSGERVPVNNGQINVRVNANSGEIWVPVSKDEKIEPKGAPEEIKEIVNVQENAKEEVQEAVKENVQETVKTETAVSKGSYEDGIIAGLQEAIIAIMEKNGPVTDQMRRDVLNNTHHDSLITWVKSFR
ncbi:MAG: alpha-amylase [Lachnospiraceae bacterium]|nr:alpha-amylase [Lachnospiraceae bacterium]